MGDGDFDDNIKDFGRFGGLAAQEGPADGGIEKQVFYEEGCSAARGAGLLFYNVSAIQHNPVAFTLGCGAGDGHFGHGGNRSDRFAAEPVCLQVEKVFGCK